MRFVSFVLHLKWIARFVRWMFERMSFAIPVERLRETDTLMAFYHPQPSYLFHVLLVPKKAIPSLKELDSTDTTFLSELYQTVQSLVDEFHLPAYRLIVNGGEYQDFPQLHFHLVAPSLQSLRQAPPRDFQGEMGGR